MAYNFSANQYENAFTSRNLHNWEVPKWYPPRPLQRTGSTKVITNERGHLLANIKRPDKSAWPSFKSTHQFPNRITRKFVDDYNEKLIKKNRWPRLVPKDPCKKSLDLEYVPGDLTDPKDRHPSRDLLLEQKEERDSGLGADLELNEFSPEKSHDFEVPKLEETDKGYHSPSPPLEAPIPFTDVLPSVPDLSPDDFKKMSLKARRFVADKPNERVPSPVVPAYANFELARRMHQDNLDHQPLPDCIADRAYRKLQASGHPFPGIGLDIEPTVTGVGLKTYNAGPTHCTKLKVYRPKTCGVVPKTYGTCLEEGLHRPLTSVASRKKMSSMDLAICWDYEPLDPRDEPPPPRHIDGSNESGGPAVFNYVKSPRTPPPSADRGRSAGIFTNTFGERDFFDKDILRKKADFGGRMPDEPTACYCPTDRLHLQRAKSLSRDIACSADLLRDRRKCSRSSPNLAHDHLHDSTEERMKENYIRARSEVMGNTFRDKIKKITNTNFFRKTPRLCHKVGPDPCCVTTTTDFGGVPCPRRAFLAGVPKYNAAGHMIRSNDSGYGSHGCSRKVVVVPRPRNPYSRKSYDIETLVPPFTSYKGGACQGGYPEHWRLSSVYQHAYKPIEQRRRPLLQTVYK